uniref:Uncharacterized protein n=1 Tax=Physcomitrium patens TaxID=3218 RepID=A0A7I3ZW28_PHYPA
MHPPAPYYICASLSATISFNCFPRPSSPFHSHSTRCVSFAFQTETGLAAPICFSVSVHAFKALSAGCILVWCLKEQSWRCAKMLL